GVGADGGISCLPHMCWMLYDVTDVGWYPTWLLPCCGSKNRVAGIATSAQSSDDGF
ncbi:hypothetical protein BHE74_00051197, partial [Ensete ventricosum]